MLKSYPIPPNTHDYISAESISGLKGIKGCSKHNIKRNIGIEHNVSDGMVSSCKYAAVLSYHSDKWCDLVKNKKEENRGMYK